MITKVTTQVGLECDTSIVLEHHMQLVDGNSGF